MGTVERDLSDLGVSWRDDTTDQAERPPRPVTAADREAAVAALRVRLGWGPSRAATLAAPCRCGAAPGEWCPRPGRRRAPVVGRLCPARGSATD